MYPPQDRRELSAALAFIGRKAINSIKTDRHRLNTRWLFVLIELPPFEIVSWQVAAYIPQLHFFLLIM
jgi:hypothetical protein